MLRCIAVDDEPLALELLVDNISKVPFLQLVGTCGNPLEAMKLLGKEKVDLIFLDIQMPGLTGLQFIQTLPEKPMIILITAYEKYALEGFNLDVVDYLVKPVPLERFIKACNKAQELFQLKHSPKEKSGRIAEFMFVNADYSLIKVIFSDITWIEGLKDYIKIHLKTTTKPVITRMSLKSIEEELPDTKFLRVQKSYIVSIAHITAVRKNSVFIGDLEIPVGENYRETLLSIIGKRDNKSFIISNKTNMKIQKIWVVAIASLLLATQAKSQTVDELVKKYVDAIGGPDKLSKINSLYEETTVSAMGNESPSTITILNGKGYKSESEFNGQKIIQCFNDKSGWVINPMAGSSDPVLMPQEQYNSGKDQIDIGGPLFNYAAKGNKVELVGRENVGSVSTYKLKIVNSANIETMVYIDPGTYYIVKLTRTMSFNGQPVDISILFSNFQKTDYGLTVANSIETSFGEQFSMTSTLKKVEVNKPIDAKIFEMPK